MGSSATTGGAVSDTVGDEVLVAARNEEVFRKMGRFMVATLFMAAVFYRI